MILLFFVKKKEKEKLDHADDMVRCWIVSQIRSSPSVELQNKNINFCQ